MTTEKQRYQVAGLSEAWLRKPRRYSFEADTALDHLDDDEDVRNVYVATLNRSPFDGLLFLTDRRLLFVRFRFARKNLVKSIPFTTIASVVTDEFDDRPAVRLLMDDRKAVMFTSVPEHERRFAKLLTEISVARE